MEFIKAMNDLFENSTPQQLKEANYIMSNVVKIVKSEESSIKYYQLNYLLTYSTDENFIYSIFKAYKSKYNVLHIVSKIMDKFEKDLISPMVYSYFLYCILVALKIEVREFNWINPTLNTLDNISMNLEPIFGHGCFMETLDNYVYTETTLKGFLVERRYITIPYGVTKIEQNAFNQMTAMDFVTFPETLVELTPGNLSEKHSLQRVLLSNKVKTIPMDFFKNSNNLFFVSARGVTELGPNSFEGTKLNTLSNISGAKLQKIGDFAFKDCFQLKKITLSHLKEIGTTPFYNCINTTELIVDVTPEMVKNKFQLYKLFELNGSDMSNYGYFKKISVNAKNGIIPEGFFEDCNNITDIIIAGDVLTIGANAFKGCSSLVNLKMNFIGNTLSDSMFEGCSSLETLPKFINVENLSNNTFKGCTSLEEIKLPKDISSFGEGTFSGCTKLRRLITNITAKELPAYSFNNCTELIDYNFLNKIKSFNSYCLSGVILPRNFKFSDTIEFIGSNAFDNCTFQNAITIPNKCIIEKLAFSNVPAVDTLICKNLEIVNTNKEEVQLYELFNDDLNMFLFKYSILKNINIDTNIVSEKAFYKWHQIDKVIFSEKLTSVCESSFEECLMLRSITFENEKASIGVNAFKNCSNLKKVKTKNNRFESDVLGVFDLTVFNQIQDGAFFNCNCTDVYLSIENDVKLTDICLGKVFAKDSKTNLQLTNVFVNCLGDKLPAGLFSGATTVKKIDITGQINELNDDLFNGCTSLDTLNLEFTGNVIPKGCFNGCTNFNKLPEFNNVDTIKEEAFKNCTSLNAINLSKNVIELGVSAFEGCTHLKEVGFELYCKVLNSYVFKNCTSLPDFLFIKEVEVFDAYSLANFNLVNKFVPPHNAKRVKSNALDGATFQNELLIRDNIIYERNSFSNVKGINKVIFNNLKLTDDEGEFLPHQLFTNNIDDFNKNSHISSVTIDTSNICDNAFKKWNLLNKIELTQNVHYLSKSCFEGCVGLITVNLPYFNIDLSNNAFADCKNLNKVTYNEEYLETTIANTPTHVFKNCKKLTEISIFIDQFILDSNIRLFAYFDDTENLFNKQFSKLKTINVFNKVKEIPAQFFKNCKKIQKINFIHEVEKFNSEVFSNCSSLNHIDVEFTGKYLSDELFNDCVKMTNFFDFKTVTSIGNKTFSGCKKIHNLNFENKIEVINENAFEYCASLVNINMEYTGDKLASNVFLNCKKLIETPKLVKLSTLEANSFSGCKSLKIVNVSGFTNQTIAQAFSGFKSINTLNFYGDKIPDRLFSGVSNLNTINFIEEINYIGNYAFENCTNLKEINCLEHVNHIGDYAFKNSNLTRISIPETIKDFGIGIFANCNSLVEIDVPIRFDFIGTLFSTEEDPKSKKLVQSSFSTERTYYLPNSLKTIKVNSGEILEGSFSNVDLELIINVKLNKIRDYSFFNCSNLSLPFMSDIRTVGDFAFANAHLENLDLSNVTSLGHSAFNGSRIDNISIGNKINEIHSSTFNKFKFVNFDIKNNIFYKFESNFLIDIKKTIILNVFDSEDDLIIPSEIQTLETNTFDSIRLKNVDTNNVRIIKANAFANCDTLESIKCPKVEKYGQNIFLNCPNIKNLELSFVGSEKISPKTLDYLFDQIPSDLNNITINGGTLFTNVLRNVRNVNELNLFGVKHPVFEEGLFKNININKLTFPKQISEVQEMSFNNVIINEVECSENSNVKYVSNCIISNNQIIYCTKEEIDSLVVNEDITYIASNAFKFVNKINHVELSNVDLKYTELFDNVKEINSISVDNIKDNPSVVFRKALNDIKEITFLGNQITDQFFKGINSYEKLVFKQLKEFKLDYLTNKLIALKTKKIEFNNLVFEEGLDVVDEEVFDFISVNNLETKNNENYFVQDNVLYSKTKILRGFNNINKSIVTPTEVVETLEGAFRNCINLQTIELTSITSISDELFENCTNLKSVKINKDCNTIGKTIFKNCTKFDYIEIPFVGACNSKLDNLTYLFGKDVYNVNIKQIKITNQDVIGKTFTQNTNLSEIILGNNVSKIEDLAFNGCENLSKVYINPNITVLNDYLFTGCKKSLKVFVDKAVVKELGTEWNKLGEDKKMGAVKVVAKSLSQEMFS
ncbi:MAG: leucine-rich repeat protein [bacterium]